MVMQCPPDSFSTEVTDFDDGSKNIKSLPARFFTVNLISPDLFINYFARDVQFNTYPVTNKAEICSFPTVKDFFPWGWMG